MAKLRRLGRAMEGAAAPLQLYAQFLLRKQLAEEDDRRQAEQNRLQRESGQMITAAQTPEVMARLARAGQMFGSVDPTHFAPGRDEILAKHATKIGESSREQMPGDLLIETQLAGDGIAKDPRPIEQLMAIRGERERRLTQAELHDLMMTKERYDANTGSKVIGPEDSPIQLSATPEQAGKNKQIELLSGELSAPVIGARGRESYTTSAGSQGGSIDAQHSRLGKIRDITDARSTGGAGAGRLPAVIQERVAAADAALYGMNQIKRLWPQVQHKIGPISGRWESMKNKMPDLGQEVDPIFAEFEAEVTGVKNTIIKYYTGAQMSEPEAKRLAAQVGEITNRPEVFPIKMRVLEANMEEMKRRMIETALGKTREELGPFKFAPDPTGDMKQDLPPTQSQQLIRWKPRGSR